MIIIIIFFTLLVDLLLYRLIITLPVDLLHYWSIITLPVDLLHYWSIIALLVDYYITGCNTRASRSNSFHFRIINACFSKHLCTLNITA